MKSDADFGFDQDIRASITAAIGAAAATFGASEEAVYPFTNTYGNPSRLRVATSVGMLDLEVTYPIHGMTHVSGPLTRWQDAPPTECAVSVDANASGSGSS